MSETAISNALLIMFIIIIFVFTVVLVVGAVCFIYAMVTDLMDAIKEREEKEVE